MWDDERMILEEFPQLYKVKSIPHSNANTTDAVGETMIVLVPDLKNKNAPNPLTPNSDIYTRTEVKEFLEKNSSAWNTYNVNNPLYQSVKIKAEIKTKLGFAFGFYSAETSKALTNYLSPWLTGDTGLFNFGGRITVAQIVYFLENLPWIDFVTNVQMFYSTNQIDYSQAVKEIVAYHPAAVLTSASEHVWMQA